MQMSNDEVHRTVYVASGTFRTPSFRRPNNLRPLRMKDTSSIEGVRRTIEATSIHRIVSINITYTTNQQRNEGTNTLSSTTRRNSQNLLHRDKIQATI